MTDLNDFQEDTESKVGEALQKVADFVAKFKKAVVGTGVVTSTLAVLVPLLGADSPVVLGVTAVAAAIGIAVPRNNPGRKLVRKGPSPAARAAASSVPKDRVEEISRRHPPTT